MLISNISSLECSISSTRCRKSFRMKRPAIKALKLRSIVPTPSSLLVDVMLEQEHRSQSNEAEDYAMKDAEGHPDKVYNMEQNSPVVTPTDEFPRLHRKSGRTEDIFIREDENGVRSHYCPLDSELDGEKYEIEDRPDGPMNFISCVEEFINCNLASDEIQSPLMAEKPSGSEESETSSIDSYTSMKYSPLENQPAGSETSVKFLKQRSNATPRVVLDEETMTRWEEYSSDDDDDSWHDYKKDCDDLIQNRTIGNESDMEEFEEDSEEIYEKNNLNLQKNSQNKDQDPQNQSTHNKSLENNTENVLNSTEKLKTENSSDVDKNFQSSNLNRQDKIENMEEKNSESGYTAENKHPNANDGVHEIEPKLNSEEENENKKEKPSNDSENNSVVKKCVHCVDIGEEETHLLETPNGLNKPDENTRDYFYNSRSEVPWQVLDDAMETAKTTNERNEAKLTMEPIAMNISRYPKNDESQPDMMSTMPLLSKAYHAKDDEELFSEKFSITDVADEIPTREKSEVFDRRDLPISKSPGKSRTAGPILMKDDKKVTPKSRNKLMTFFQSVKRKLERSKKA